MLQKRNFTSLLFVVVLAQFLWVLDNTPLSPHKLPMSVIDRPSGKIIYLRLLKTLIYLRFIYLSFGHEMYLH